MYLLYKLHLLVLLEFLLITVDVNIVGLYDNCKIVIVNVRTETKQKEHIYIWQLPSVSSQ